MASSEDFIMEVECRVYEMERDVDAGKHSNVMPGSFAGWVSLSSKDLDLRDEQVFELLDSAHARQSFIRQFLKMHDRQSGCLRTLGVHGRVEYDNAWVSCRVTDEYLESVISEMENGDVVLESLEEYDTPVEVV